MNGELLNRFIGLTVSIVGKIDSVAGNTAIITTSVKVAITL